MNVCPECGDPEGSFFKLAAAMERQRDKALASSNYVANAEVNPTRILFANGRVVELVDGRLVVGWAREEADAIFKRHSENSKP
jgi:hypothetical protein